MKIGDVLTGSSFAAQLNDQRWKDFVGGIRKGRGNFCEICRRSDVPLEGHHIFYQPGLKLWEYDQSAIVMLCSGCHKGMHEQFNAFRKRIFSKLTPELFRVLNDALEIGLTNENRLDFVHAVKEMATSPSSIERFAYAWNNGKKPESQAAYNATERDYKKAT